MKKTISTVLLAVLLGFTITKGFTKGYTRTTSSTSQLVYFLQYGVFSSYESMKKNTTSLENYIYITQEDKYYVFLGFTQKKENCQKLKDYLTNNSYNIYVKELYISNQELLNIIPTYDALIEKVTDTKSIQYILKEQLEKYKEVMIN